MTIEEIYAIASNAEGWRVLPNGNGVKLGDGVKLGNWVTYKKTPLQIQCHPYIVYPHSPRRIGVGCVMHDIDYWLREQDPAELAEHPECQPWSTYRAAIALVAAHMGHDHGPKPPIGDNGGNKPPLTPQRRS